MSPELRAFIDSIKRSTSEDSRKKAEPVHNFVRSIARQAAALFAFIGDALEEMGPYACELRPVEQFKTAVGKCAPRGDAIGHHGLA